MYANEDIYSGPVDPTNRINPKIVGAFYINTTTAKLFVCTNNTINNNTWKICNPDIKIPEIPPPAPLYFTTCEWYTLANGPYRNYVTYTNLDNKPIHITLTCNLHGDEINDIYMIINGNMIASSTAWGNNISGLIVPGATFMLFTTTPDFNNAPYLVVK